MEQNEIYLIDIWRIFVREWKWFVAMLALTLACVFAFTHVVKPQWEATAWIQIGQVGLVPAGQAQQVEPLLRVIERLQMVSFENEILKSVGFSPDAPAAALYRKSLKLDPLPYAGPLIRLKVRARSPEQARQFAMATVTWLHAVHQPIEARLLKSAHARLGQIQDDLQGALAERERLRQDAMPGGKAGTDSKDMAAPLLADMLLVSKNQEIRGLQQARIDATDRLGLAYTFETSMPWPIYVPHKHVFPNAALAWGIGILLGIFLGACAAIARNVARRQAQD